MNCIAADEIRLEVKQGRAIGLAAVDLRRAAHLMLAEIDEMLVVDARVFDMRDERAAPNHRPDAIGQAGDDPLDRGPQGDKICRNHGVVAGDLPLPGEHRGTSRAENPGGDRTLQDTVRWLATWRTRGQPTGRTGRSAVAGGGRYQFLQRQGDSSEKHFSGNRDDDSRINTNVVLYPS